MGRFGAGDVQVRGAGEGDKGKRPAGPGRRWTGLGREEERERRGRSWASAQLCFFFVFQILQREEKKEIKTKVTFRVLIIPQNILLFCKFKITLRFALSKIILVFNYFVLQFRN